MPRKAVETPVEYHKIYYKDNKEKIKNQQREYYLKNKEKVHTRVCARRRNRKLQAIEYLGGRCADCHGIFHKAVYDFHHLDPAEKEFNMAHALSHTQEKLKKELDKCVLLCSNCHRIRHYDLEEEDAEGEPGNNFISINIPTIRIRRHFSGKSSHKSGRIH